MNTIKDFLALDTEERLSAAHKYGKFLAERYAPGRTIQLYEICDTLVELYFDKSDVLIRETKLLDSSGTLDLYIDSMLEKKKKEKALRHGFFRVHRSLLSLVKNYLLWYEDIYLPEDTAGMLVSGDIPFMHRREKYYDKRKGEEEQTDIYGYVILMEGASDEEDTCTYSPGNPLDYERPCDRFFVLIFCPSQKMFLGCRMYEMQEVDGKLKPVIIWSDRKL